ncbi:CHAT domain-containing protein [Massilia sp. LjRoot122]|uniref:CHAT domain-containing protein n=1 Tax=Massilia sp. LjRoot122 TaxID=3342257 RepID=UPI003ECC38C2
MAIPLLLASPYGGAQHNNSPAPSAFDAAQVRVKDVETLKSLLDEGRILYEKERIKLDGAQYCAQAVALAERGEFRQSIQAASKALLLAQQQSNADLVASAKRDLAITYSYAGDLERGEQYAKEALASQAVPRPVVAGPVLKVLGDIASRRTRYADAIAFYRQAETAASEKYRPLIQISLANAYLHDGQLKQARSLYQQIGQPPDALRHAFKRGLANLSLAEGEHAQALRLFTEVAQEAGGSDAAYHRLWGQEGMGRTLLRMNDRAGARRAYLDAARSAEGMRNRFRSEEFKSGLFGDVQQIFDRAIKLSVEMGDFDSAWLLSEQSRSRALLDVVRDRVAPGAQPSAASTAPLTRAVVGAALRKGEAILEFHSLDDRLIAWVIRPAGIEGHVIPVSRTDLSAAVDSFRQAIFTRSASTGTHGAALHALLIEPLRILPAEQLLIVPHDSLHYLPFQALQHKGSYLIERNALAFSPSASLALQLTQRGNEQSGKLVAFGNPGTDAALALPNAEAEVKLIGDLFPNKEIFIREAASKRRFRDIASSASILHVAAHAEVDRIDPLQSRILLAPEENDAGFLEAREIFGLNLNSVSLVTLSACESGLGRIARGDEIMGFTRSFLSAGASTLLVSLWPVADDSTELLMSTVYAELANGSTAMAAMQKAQLTVLKQPRYAQPFFWAPFDLVGDWRMQIRKPGTI